MKKSILFILFLLIILTSSENIYAANGLCTKSAMTKIKSKTSDITASWDLNFDENHQAYFTAKLENVDKDLILIFNESNYLPKDGVINIREYLIGGEIYEFKIYGGYDTDCVEEYVTTKKLKIPKYNIYSERKECIEYPSWELCDKFYEGDLNDEIFYNKLNEYIKKNKEVEKKEEISKTRNKYIIIIAIALVVTGSLVSYVCVNNKRIKKVKYEKK